MLKTLMMSAALSALMISGALAQASPPAASPPEAKADAAPMDGAKFIQSQSTDQWVFSKFKGTNVVGPDNAQVGTSGRLPKTASELPMVGRVGMPHFFETATAKQ